MKVTVFRLRLHGRLQPAPRPGVWGELTLRVGPLAYYYPGQLRAKLLGTEVPELDKARVSRITERGIILSGVEIVPRRSNNKASVDQWRQTWWCRLDPHAPGSPERKLDEGSRWWPERGKNKFGFDDELDESPLD